MFESRHSITRSHEIITSSRDYLFFLVVLMWFRTYPLRNNTSSNHGHPIVLHRSGTQWPLSCTSKLIYSNPASILHIGDDLSAPRRHFPFVINRGQLSMRCLIRALQVTTRMQMNRTCILHVYPNIFKFNYQLKSSRHESDWCIYLHYIMIYRDLYSTVNLSLEDMNHLQFSVLLYINILNER